jgi:hypothetical protein
VVPLDLAVNAVAFGSSPIVILVMRVVIFFAPEMCDPVETMAYFLATERRCASRGAIATEEGYRPLSVAGN